MKNNRFKQKPVCIFILLIYFTFSGLNYIVYEQSPYQIYNNFDLLDNNKLPISHYPQDTKFLNRTVINGRNGWLELKNQGSCTGNGTQEDPFLIEQCVFDGNQSGLCLKILNSNEFFEIKNCSFVNSGTTYDDNGVFVGNSSNGKFFFNIFEDVGFGLKLDHSNSNTIIGNAFQCSYGLNLFYCNSNIAYFNSFETSNFGVYEKKLGPTYHNQMFSTELTDYTYENQFYRNRTGNYYSGYRHADEDGDGIGDTLEIAYDHHDGFYYCSDAYPLIAPLRSYSNITYYQTDYVKLLYNETEQWNKGNSDSDSDVDSDENKINSFSIQFFFGSWIIGIILINIINLKKNGKS